MLHKSIDQLSFIIRYVASDGKPLERFMKFIPNTGHKAEEILKAFTDAINEFGLDIANCLGQSYDNIDRFLNPELLHQKSLWNRMKK